ncbi:alpha/beta hydrolase [Winogradskya consettensis]|uniref:Alpha/beta hydrolase n=1 Tax=Winogradskya consettensis TaxID=113560 RepID=A0A919SNC8_9ACTN|nr:alpha/beta hydrolase [Actinoplanes consettensis]GIM74659.1 alpha/beta hydrolase [Actinoplanes consettensis]
MTITLDVVMGTDPGRIDAEAYAWEAMAGALDDATGSLIGATRDLGTVWPAGAAAEAASREATLLRAEASNAVLPCRAVARALRDHAATIRALQDTATALSAEAKVGGYRVDLSSGVVVAAEGVYERASALSCMHQRMDGYVQQLQGIVDRAAESDARTSAAITAGLPDRRNGFGSAPAVAVTEDQVRARQGRPPAEVNLWWLGLSPERQEQAIRDFPQLVGGLDGVPCRDRDAANRRWLSRRLADLAVAQDAVRNRLPHVTPRSGEDYELWRRLRVIGEELDGLAAVRRGLERAGAQGLLLGVDSAGDGRTVIAVGDPDAATHTAVWVPGLGTTIGNTRGNVERMVQLQREASRAGESVATVYWLGYDAPEVLSVAGSDRSRAGAAPYAAFMQGLRATHDGEPGHLVAMGHSYGSTVVGEAALTGQLPVDDIVTQGSPGVHTDRATALTSDPRHVWIGSSPTDPVSTTGGPVMVPIAGTFLAALYDGVHGPSPQAPAFGANEYDADTFFHLRYWDPGSDSLRNQAAIVSGAYSAVDLDHGQAPPDWPR